LSTARAALLIIVILAVIGGGVYLATQQASPATTQTTSAATNIPSTLVIDDTTWPTDDLNALYQVQYFPWPYWLEHTVYQPLVATNVVKQFQEGVVDFVPDLATNWTASPDSTTYTFNLRPAVTFSSGNPLNSYQVWTEMYTWYYLNGNGTNFLGGLNLFDMSNVNFGPASYATLNASGLVNPSGDALRMMENATWPIYTNGPSQIVFHTKAPFLYLTGVLSGYEGLIWDAQWMLQHGGPGTPTQYNSYFNLNPIPGTGPYVVADLSVNSYVKFEQNPNYWGLNLNPGELTNNVLLRPGEVKTVIVRAVTDDVARYTDLATGDAQLTAIRISNWNRVTSNPKYSWITVNAPGAIQTALAMNTVIFPTNITAVRQAIAHGINYTDIWNKVYLGEASAIMGPETPNYGKYYDPGNFTPYDFNVSEAKAFLAKAGFPNGTGLPTLTLRTVTGCSICINAAQIIQTDLANIGINIIINEVSYSTYYGPYGNYQTNLQNAAQLGQLSFLGGDYWAATQASPTDFWISFVCSCSLYANWAVYSNPIVDQAVGLLSTSDNETQILSSLSAAQKQIWNDAPYAWIAATKLWYIDGSFVWKTSLIKEVWFDPEYSGINTAPLFNTILFN
jgi:ABC-type transport system substrate-binding protein